MPAKGMTQVKSNLTKLFETIAGPMTEKTVTEVISIGGLYADLLTPIDTSNLINSRYRSVRARPKAGPVNTAIRPSMPPPCTV